MFCRFEAIAFCPGYARGLAMHGDFLIVGLSKCRDNRTFNDLPLNKALTERKVEALCGLQAVDLRSGDVVHTLQCFGVLQELYDVAVLPGIHNRACWGCAPTRSGGRFRSKRASDENSCGQMRFARRDRAV